MGNVAADPGHSVAKEHGLKRSDHWPAVRNRHLKMDPKCAVCGDEKVLQVHHIIPFHVCILIGRPELELCHRNLITVCECKEHDHHLLLGHLGDFKSYNHSVRRGLKKFAKMTDVEIKACAAWKKMMAKRPSGAHKWTKKEIDALKLRVDRLYPVIT